MFLEKFFRIFVVAYSLRRDMYGVIRYQNLRPKKMHEKVHAATQPRNIQVQSISLHARCYLEYIRPQIWDANLVGGWILFNNFTQDKQSFIMQFRFHF